MDEDAAARKRLGDEVARCRRDGLGLTVAEAAARAPMVASTWTNVEQGRPVSKATYAAVERVLKQEPGWCRAFISGTVTAAVDPQPAAVQSALRMLDLAQSMPPSPERDRIIADLRTVLTQAEAPPLRESELDRHRKIG